MDIKFLSAEEVAEAQRVELPFLVVQEPFVVGAGEKINGVKATGRSVRMAYVLRQIGPDGLASHELQQLVLEQAAQMQLTGARDAKLRPILVGPVYWNPAQGRHEVMEKCIFSDGTERDAYRPLASYGLRGLEF